MRMTKEMAFSIQNRVYALLDELGEHSFDYSHIRTVEHHCVELAKIRGLDPDIGRIIGLLHDVGRYECYCYGGEHGPVGAKRAIHWLAEYDIDDDVVSLITDAIAVHGKKKRIHGLYEELVKDADSIAHEDEFPGEQSKYEHMRAQLSYKKRLSLKVAEPSVVLEAFHTHVEQLKDDVHDLDFSYMSASEVHDVRIGIRILRALLWLLDHEGVTRIQNRQLKKLFKVFERSRKLSVLRKTLKKAGIDSKKTHKLTVLIKKENRHLASKVQKRLLKEAVMFDDLSKSGIGGEVDIEAKMSAYYQILLEADLNSLESLHSLRVAGKKFKYLIEEGILVLEEETDLKLFQELHDMIGKLNDVAENRLMLETLALNGKLILSSEEKSMIEDYLEIQESKIKKKVKYLVFFMRKRWP